MTERMRERGWETDLFHALKRGRMFREQLFAGRIGAEQAPEFLISQREADRIAERVGKISDWALTLGIDRALYPALERDDLVEAGRSKWIDTGNFQLSANIYPPNEEIDYQLHLFTYDKNKTVNLTFGFYDDFALELQWVGGKSQEYVSSRLPLDLMTLEEHVVIKRCLDRASQNIPVPI